MPKIAPIYLDTNFCRDPHVLRTCFGPNVGLLLDLLVFAAAKTHVAEGYRRPELLPPAGEGRWVRFHASDFYQEFGYNRQAVLAPPSSRLREHVFAGGRKAHEATYGQTVLEATLFSMCSNTLLFTKRLYQQFGPDRKQQELLKSLQIFQDLHITRATKAGLPGNSDELDGPPAAQQGVEEAHALPAAAGRPAKVVYLSFSLRVGGIFIRNNHYRPQPLVLADYLSLRTGGPEDPASDPRRRQARGCANSRLLYCRLLWRWGAWQGEATRHLSQQEEQFGELCALLDWQPSAMAAVRMNRLLAKVCAVDSLPFTAVVQQSKQRQTLQRNLAGTVPLAYVVVLRRKGSEAAQVNLKTQQFGLEL